MEFLNKLSHIFFAYRGDQMFLRKAKSKMLINTNFRWFLTSLFCSVRYAGGFLMYKWYFTDEWFSSCQLILQFIFKSTKPQTKIFVLYACDFIIPNLLYQTRGKNSKISTVQNLWVAHSSVNLLDIQRSCFSWYIFLFLPMVLWSVNNFYILDLQTESIL